MAKRRNHRLTSWFMKDLTEVVSITNGTYDKCCTISDVIIFAAGLNVSYIESKTEIEKIDEHFRHNHSIYMELLTKFSLITSYDLPDQESSNYKLPQIYERTTIGFEELKIYSESIKTTNPILLDMLIGFNLYPQHFIKIIKHEVSRVNRSMSVKTKGTTNEQQSKKSN